MRLLAGDDRLRRSLSEKGAAQAAKFTWDAAARAALAAFEDAARS
jgi:hypothetical protein